MKTYMSIKAEIAKLEKQAEAARKAEIADVVGKIKHAIAAYGLTADDLGFGRGVSSRTQGRKSVESSSRPKRGVARYRDPASGKTWTGQGRPPAWIVDAKDRDAFLIGSGPSAPTSAAGKVRAATKRQVVAKRAPAGKKGRGGRKAAPAPVKAAAVQIESSAASE